MIPVLQRFSQPLRRSPPLLLTDMKLLTRINSFFLLSQSSLKPNELRLKLMLIQMSPRPPLTHTTRSASSPSLKTEKTPSNASSLSSLSFSHLMSTRSLIKLWDCFRQFWYLKLLYFKFLSLTINYVIVEDVGPGGPYRFSLPIIH